MRGKRHPDETRAQVMAALLTGQGVLEVATQYNIDKSIVSRWRQTIPQEQLQLIASQKGQIIEGLLFDYLNANLVALRAQAEAVSEKQYIIKQPADSLAVLHGVMADKSIRLLEAIHRANQLPRQIEAGEAEN